MAVAPGLEHPPASPADTVAGARELLGHLEQVMWAARPAGELLSTTVELELLRSRLAAVEARVAAEIDATDAAKVEGWASPGDYLTATSGARRGAGQRLLRTARALTGDRDATLTALHAGAVSPEHAEVIVRVVDLLPIDPGIRAEAESFLLEQAATLNATELRIAGEHLLEVLDPDGTARREERRLDKHERSAHLNRSLSIIDDGLGGVKVRGRGTVEDAAVIKTALAALSAPLQDADVLPECHGTKPRVTVLLDYDALVTGIGTATLDTGDRLSAAAVRKLACDADLIPAVLGTDGEVLDVGRNLRLASVAIWKALVARDRHCRFPGCRRPPIACDAHHIVHWADGGPTSLDNLVLLCRAHHTLLHSTDWEVRLNPHDRKPEFHPPPLGRRLRTQFKERLDERDGWVRERTPRA